MLSESSDPTFIPEVQVTIDFDSSIGSLLGTSTPVDEALKQALSAALADLLSTLGIPGKPNIEIGLSAPDRLPSGHFMRVSVNGSLCHYSDELLRLIHGYSNGIQPQPTASPDKILNWLHELADEQSETVAPNRVRLVGFLGLCCAEIIKLTPASLLRETQVDAYIASLPSPTGSKSVEWPPAATWLIPILSALLDLRISIADQQVVSNVLGQASGRSQADIIEDLIVALRPQVIEIQLPREYLKELTLANQADGIETFPSLRDGLFTELGMRYPAFHFTPTEHLKPNSFAFRINHLVTHPYIGLLADQCLVNDTVERLKLMGVGSYPASNPATGQPSSVVALDLKEQLEADGLTTWNQMGYLILSFAEILRRQGACFIDRQATVEHLDQLDKAFPAVVKAAREIAPVEQVTRVLRQLTKDQLTIRNLTLILERILDYCFLHPNMANITTAVQQPTSNLPPNETQLNSLGDLMSFLRFGLNRYISNKYSRGTRTLVAYLIDSELETMLVKRGTPMGNANEPASSWKENDDTMILEAIRAEIALLPPTAQLPVLLTTSEARPVLTKLIRCTLPRMSVVSHQELWPDINVQPIARISLIK